MQAVENLINEILQDEELASIEHFDYPSNVLYLICVNEYISKLIFLCKNSQKALDNVLQIFGDLVDENEELDFGPPQDAALSALLYVIIASSPVLAKSAAINVLRVPNIYWAEFLAKSHLLNEEIKKTA